MGTYATTTAISTLLVDFNTLTSANSAMLSKCITHAENEVNKYLSKRYDTSSWNTTTAIPPTVTSLTETYAEGLFWVRASRGGKETIARGQALIKMALENLKDIAAYKADLVDSTGTLVTRRSDNLGVLSNTDGYNSTFAEDDPLDWEVDADKLNDLSTLRG